MDDWEPKEESLRTLKTLVHPTPLNQRQGPGATGGPIGTGATEGTEATGDPGATEEAEAMQEDAGASSSGAAVADTLMQLKEEGVVPE